MDTREEARARKSEVFRMLKSLGLMVRWVSVLEEDGRWWVKAVLSRDIPDHLKKDLANEGIRVDVPSYFLD